MGGYFLIYSTGSGINFSDTIDMHFVGKRLTWLLSLLQTKLIFVSYPHILKISLGSSNCGLSKSLKGTLRSSFKLHTNIFFAFMIELLGKRHCFILRDLIQITSKIFENWGYQTGKYLLTRISFQKPFISQQQSKSTENKYSESIINWCVNFDFDLGLCWRLYLRPYLLDPLEIFRICG